MILQVVLIEWITFKLLKCFLVQQHSRGCSEVFLNDAYLRAVQRPSKCDVATCR